MKGEYRRTKDYNYETGKARQICPHFQLIDEIEGDRPSVVPVYVLDSSANAQDETGTSGARQAMQRTLPELNGYKICLVRERVTNTAGQMQEALLSFLDDFKEMDKKYLDMEAKRMVREEEEEEKRRDWMSKENRERDKFLLDLAKTMFAGKQQQ